jgi:DNA-binding NtrC family response regulator
VLTSHGWPGNVRELRNVIERVAILAGTDPIDLEHLAPSLRQSPPGASRYELMSGMTIAEAEHRLIELTLEHTSNNKTRAARSLGITVKTLHNKLNRFRMRGPRHGEAATEDKTTTHDQTAASGERTPGGTRSPDP